jgi:hypothetical protein
MYLSGVRHSCFPLVFDDVDVEVCFPLVVYDLNFHASPTSSEFDQTLGHLWLGPGLGLFSY